MAQAVDIVIPVYNAPDATRRCIASLYAHVGHRIGQVVVHDDASDAETADMLDALDFPGLVVHHAAQNRGFGAGVNFGVARARTDFVLVLNSDTEARDDFLSPLVETLAASPELATLTPAGSSFRNYELSRYLRRDGCVVTYNLNGYAFLARRRALDGIGGFDPVFGRGFFEDRDLSRRLLRDGWWLGVHPEAQLQHAIHGSFRQVAAYRELMARNRLTYFERYPEARRRVWLVSGARAPGALPPELRDAADAVLRDGGDVHWYCPGAPETLPALQVEGARLRLPGALLGVYRRRGKPFKRFTDAWLTADAPRAAGAWVARLAAHLGLAVRRFHAAT